MSPWTPVCAANSANFAMGWLLFAVACREGTICGKCICESNTTPHEQAAAETDKPGLPASRHQCMVSAGLAYLACFAALVRPEQVEVTDCAKVLKNGLDSPSLCNGRHASKEHRRVCMLHPLYLQLRLAAGLNAQGHLWLCQRQQLYSHRLAHLLLRACKGHPAESTRRLQLD